jgi:hypothetical protein
VVEEFVDAVGVVVGLEAGEEGGDEVGAAGCAGSAGQEQGLGGGDRGGFGFAGVEMAGGAVGEEDAAGLVPGGGQEAFAVGDELSGAGGVAEVEEGLAGVDGEVGVGEPRAPGGPVATGAAQVVFGGSQGAQGRPAFAECGVGAGEAQVEEAAGGGVAGAGEGVGEQLAGEGVVALPGGLVGEVVDAV